MSTLEVGMRLRLCGFKRICAYAVAVFRISAYIFNMRMMRILIYAVYADIRIMHMSFPNRIYVSAYTNKSKHSKTDCGVSDHNLT